MLDLIDDRVLATRVHGGSIALSSFPFVEAALQEFEARPDDPTTNANSRTLRLSQPLWTKYQFFLTRFGFLLVYIKGSEEPKWVLNVQMYQVVEMGDIGNKLNCVALRPKPGVGAGRITLIISGPNTRTLTKQLSTVPAWWTLRYK